MLMNYFISILLYPSESKGIFLTTKDCFFGDQIYLACIPHRCVANETSWVYALCLSPCYAECHILVLYISHVFYIVLISVCLQVSIRLLETEEIVIWVVAGPTPRTGSLHQTVQSLIGTFYQGDPLLLAGPIFPSVSKEPVWTYGHTLIHMIQNTGLMC